MVAVVNVRETGQVSLWRTNSVYSGTLSPLKPTDRVHPFAPYRLSVAPMMDWMDS